MPPSTAVPVKEDHAEREANSVRLDDAAVADAATDAAIEIAEVGSVAVVVVASLGAIAGAQGAVAAQFGLLQTVLAGTVAGALAGAAASIAEGTKDSTDVDKAAADDTRQDSDDNGSV